MTKSFIYISLFDVLYIINYFTYHKYYFEEGSNIIVEVFDDRVVITNFGGLPSGVVASKFGIENISIQRNPVIADLLL
ncbi:MAG TPA: ATP-binding protein [Aquella sp.]|nr:ATP-binding protein [Aquella sp.]